MGSPRWLSLRSLQGRLLLSIAGVSLTLFVGLSLLLARVTEGLLLERQDSETRHVAYLIENTLQNTRVDMARQVDLMLADPALRVSLASPALKDYLASAVGKSRIGFLEVVRNDYKTLAATNELLSSLKGVEELRLMNGALQGRGSSPLYVRRAGQIYLFMSQPVQGGKTAAAALNAWIALDNVWTWDLFNIAEMHVLVGVDGLVSAASEQTMIGTRLVPEGEALQGGPKEFRVGKLRYRFHILPLATSDGPSWGFIGTGTDLTLYDKAIAQARRLTTRAVAAASALLLLLMFWLTFRLTSSFSSLAAATKEIATEGPDKFKGVAVRPSDPEEIKTLAESLNRMAQALDVRLKNVERANQELRRAKDKAVRAEKLAAIGQLASGVGHELRNPLGAIRNAIYYFRDALSGSPLIKEDPTFEEFLTLAEREIDSAVRIIGDLLAFSRVVNLAPEHADLHELLHQAQGVIEVPSNVGIVFQLADQMPRVRIDPQKMRQVFVNLANNAVQAMPDGGRLTVHTRVEPDGNKSHVCVEFADTGSGISAEHLSTIFEPLFTTKAKGTGLGLAISQGIVKAHGGSIEVASEAGKGATFTVRFPADGPSA